MVPPLMDRPYKDLRIFTWYHRYLGPVANVTAYPKYNQEFTDPMSLDGHPGVDRLYTT